MIDDDDFGVMLSIGTIQVVRNGREVYEVLLASQPTAPVLVELHASYGVWVAAPLCDDSGEQGACLYFDAENWNQLQRVAVQAIASGQVSRDLISRDPTYADLSPFTVEITASGGNAVFLPVITNGFPVLGKCFPEAHSWGEDAETTMLLALSARR